MSQAKLINNMYNYIEGNFVRINIGCSFKCILKVGVDELIVNAPRSVYRVKTQTTQKVRLDLNS
jgi:hypothetical protein